MNISNKNKKVVNNIFTESALRPIQSESRDVRLSVCVSVGGGGCCACDGVVISGVGADYHIVDISCGGVGLNKVVVVLKGRTLLVVVYIVLVIMERYWWR